MDHEDRFHWPEDQTTKALQSQCAEYENNVGNFDDCKEFGKKPPKYWNNYNQLILT
jgi:hypothetical protein